MEPHGAAVARSLCVSLCVSPRIRTRLYLHPPPPPPARGASAETRGRVRVGERLDAPHRQPRLSVAVLVVDASRVQPGGGQRSARGREQRAQSAAPAVGLHAAAGSQAGGGGVGGHLSPLLYASLERRPPIAEAFFPASPDKNSSSTCPPRGAVRRPAHRCGATRGRGGHVSCADRLADKVCRHGGGAGGEPTRLRRVGDTSRCPPRSLGTGAASRARARAAAPSPAPPPGPGPGPGHAPAARGTPAERAARPAAEPPLGKARADAAAGARARTPSAAVEARPPPRGHRRGALQRAHVAQRREARPHLRRPRAVSPPPPSY